MTQLRIAPSRPFTGVAAAPAQDVCMNLRIDLATAKWGDTGFATSDLSRVKRALYHFEALGCRPLWAILNVPEPG